MLYLKIILNVEFYQICNMKIVYVLLVLFAIALNSFSNSTTDVYLITVKNDSTLDELENEKLIMKTKYK